jgi:hypothetical protein
MYVGLVDGGGYPSLGSNVAGLRPFVPPMALSNMDYVINWISPTILRSLIWPRTSFFVM